MISLLPVEALAWVSPLLKQSSTHQIGLNDDRKDELAQVKPLSHLDDLMDLLIRFDDCLTEWHHECGPAPQALTTP